MLEHDDLSAHSLYHPEPHAHHVRDELSTREAALALGLNVRTIRRAIERGELPALKQGSSYRIAADDLMRYASRSEARSSIQPPARLVAFPTPPTVTPALPRPLSPFIGRAADVAALVSRLTDPAVRLLTLTGPGGIGKTRLSLAAASAAQAHFPDGVAFVELAAISQPELVLPTISQTLGLREVAGRDRNQQLRAFLAEKRLLLIVDNLEHLLAAASDIAAIAAAAPGVTLLATSRAPLRVAGEQEFPVSPLSLLPIDQPRTVSSLLASDAARLFIARAQAHDPGLSVEADTAPLIAEICAQLDGLPLAIELAAARVKVLPLWHLHERLEHRLPLLTGGVRNGPERHGTMRDAIAWSYDLLSPAEQRLFRTLAIFAGSFTLDAAEWVGRRGADVEKGRASDDASTASSPDALDLLGSLLDQSMVIRDVGTDGETPPSGRGGLGGERGGPSGSGGHGGEPRFRMLETIREFGLERLADAGEIAAARSDHAHYFLALAGSLGRPGALASDRRGLNIIAADYANVTAALEWLDERGPTEQFVRLVGLLPGFWYASSLYRDGRTWLQRALGKAEQAAPLDRARVLLGLARFHILHGEYAAAEPYFDACVPLLRIHGDVLETAGALVWRGAMASFAGDPLLAEVALSEALTLADQVDDPLWRAILIGNLLSNLGNAARARGEFDLAEERHDQALRHFQEHGSELGINGWYRDTAALASDRGDLPLAVERYLSCLARIGERGDMEIVAEALAGIGSAATAWGYHRRGVLLFAAADALRERIGIAMILPGDIAATARSIDTLRDALPDEVFAAAWAEGRAMSLERALATAAAVTPPSDRPPLARPPVTSPLTRRELDVLRLLAAGQTDRDIAEALFIGQRTVSWHVSSILGKLDANSRREAVERARTAGFI